MPAPQEYRAAFKAGLPGAAGGNGERRQSGQLGNPEIHYDGTPIVTVRLVNGLQQDVPHLYVDSRGGQTRWWVERESRESWQERVRALQESGDERYKDVSPDRLPSSVTHNYPSIPASVLERQPEYRNREWITLSYSLTPAQEEQGRVALTPNQEGEVVTEEHTFLNTPRATDDETTSFRRSVRLVVAPSFFLDETLPTEQVAPQGELKPQAKVEDEEDK